jgi:hypothetical protein
MIDEVTIVASTAADIPHVLNRIIVSLLLKFELEESLIVPVGPATGPGNLYLRWSFSR